MGDVNHADGCLTTDAVIWRSVKEYHTVRVGSGEVVLVHLARGVRADEIGFGV